jgi:hypothetical protein
MKIVHVELQRHSVAAEVHLNGWPLIHCGHRGLARVSLAAEEFIVNGQNTLSLWIEPNPSPPQWNERHDGSAAADAWAVARVVAYPPDVVAEPQNGDVLATITWRSSSGALPTSVSTKFQRPGRRWIWESAPPLRMSSDLLAEASRVLTELQRAFNTRDQNLLEKLLAVKIREALRAYPALTNTYVRDGLRQFLAALQQSPGGPSEPLRPAAHAMRLIADERVLECLNSDFLPSLRLHDEDGDLLPYEVRLARIEGRLQVVR